MCEHYVKNSDIQSTSSISNSLTKFVRESDIDQLFSVYSVNGVSFKKANVIGGSHESGCRQYYIDTIYAVSVCENDTCDGVRYLSINSALCVTSLYVRVFDVLITSQKLHVLMVYI